MEWCEPNHEDDTTARINTFVIYQRKLKMMKAPGKETVWTWMSF